MPESLNTSDLSKLRQLAPSDPYNRYNYNYSLFMGDDPAGRGGCEEIRVQPQTHPVLRMMKDESVSKNYPYVFAQGNEWALPAGWDYGYLSYYALSGVDQNGPYIEKSDKKVNVPARMVRASFQNSDATWAQVPVAPFPPAPMNTLQYPAIKMDTSANQGMSPGQNFTPDQGVGDLDPEVPLDTVANGTQGSWNLYGKLPSGKLYSYNFQDKSSATAYGNTVINSGGTAMICPQEAAPAPAPQVAASGINKGLALLLAIPAAYLFLKHR